MKSPGQHPNTSARRGNFGLDVVDTVLSTAAYRAEKETEGDPADAIVWDELVARTREEGLNVTLLTSRQITLTQGASGSVVSKGWISVSPPGPAAAETNPRTRDVASAPSAGRTRRPSRFRGRWSGRARHPSWPRPFLGVTLRPHQADHAGEVHRRFIDLNHQNGRYGSTAPEGVAGFQQVTGVEG